jgi:hypothetical protein
MSRAGRAGRMRPPPSSPKRPPIWFGWREAIALRC